MKKIFGLAAALVLLAGCDDGEMTFNTFDFTDADVVLCNTDSNIRFKINDNGTEVLILDIDIASVLVNAETPVDVPREVNVSGTNLIYRNYDGNVSTTTLCSTIPPVSPSVIDEWLGDGVLQIITRKVYDPDDITHLTGYSHQITLKNVTFTKVGSNEQVVITDNNYGVILRNLNFEFDFETTVSPLAELTPCNNNATGPFYRLNGTEALVLSLDPAIINSTDTTIPILIDLSDSQDDNDLVLRVYSSSVFDTNICSVNPPITPTEKERWEAYDGQIKIVTTQSGSTYTHTVHLIAPQNSTGVNFKNNNNEIYVVEGADYVIGIFKNEL
ncbi:MAG: hypothetical protein V4581_14600 [Bacteroidota bacterium]